MDVRPLSPDFAVLDRQMTPDDVPAIAGAGFRRIINNRPDDEAPAGARGADIAAACAAAGIAYAAVPFHPGRITSDMLEAFSEAASAPLPVLAYCRSGTRSSTLWALTRTGMTTDEILEAANAAGYDLSNIREMIDTVAQMRL